MTNSQVMLEFGTPLVITPEDVNSEAFRTDDHGEVKRLTQLLENKMHAITLNAAEFSTIRVARVMRRLYLNTSSSIDANQEVRLTQHIVTLLERDELSSEKKARIDAIRGKVARYQDELEKLRIKDQDLLLPIQKHSVLQLFLERVMYLLVLLPLATPGLLINFPYYIIGACVCVSCVLVCVAAVVTLLMRWDRIAGHKLNSLAGYVESKSMFKIFAAAYVADALPSCCHFLVAESPSYSLVASIGPTTESWCRCTGC